MPLTQRGRTALAAFDRKFHQIERDELARLLEEPVHAPLVHQVFQAGLFSIGPVAIAHKYPEHGRRKGHRIGRFDQEPAITRELFVAGDAAKFHPEIDSLVQRNPSAAAQRCSVGRNHHAHRHEPDVVCVRNRVHSSPTLKRDVELARQVVHFAVVQNVMVQGMGVGPDVQQFLPVESGRWTGSDVANIVRAGSARGETGLLQARENIENVAGLNLANLKVRPRRERRLPVAIRVGEVGEGNEFFRGEFTGGNTAPEHERLLCRRHVKQPLESESEIVCIIRCRVFGRELQHSIPGIEPVQFVFPKFLFVEVLQRRAMNGLRNGYREIGATRRGIVGERSGRHQAHVGIELALGNAGHQPVQVRFLFPREPLGWCRRRINQHFGGIHDSVGGFDTNGARFIAWLPRVRIKLGVGQTVHVRIMHRQKNLSGPDSGRQKRVGVNTTPP